MSQNNRKIGRNDKCPCGSGKKFKHCHGGVNEPRKPHIGQADKRLSQLTPKPQCLAPSSMKNECHGKIIDSHSVSRSGSLGMISREGHVYSTKPSMLDLENHDGNFQPKLLGAKRASTFPGFCSYHDKSIFSNLEDKNFIGNRHQCFLLSYRSLSRELYAKQCAVQHAAYRNAMAMNSTPETRAYILDRNYVDEINLRDLERHKEKYDTVLESKNWKECEGLIIEFDEKFPIQCSAAYEPSCDINNNPIQQLEDTSITPEIVTINSFAADEKSYFLLSWLKTKSVAAKKLADSIKSIDKDRLPGVIGSYLLLTSDNCHISPEWYDNLPQSGKELTIKLINNLFFKPSPCSVSIEGYLNNIKANSVSMIS